jgi:hypothetical protein
MDMLESNHRRHSFALIASREHPQRLPNMQRRMPLQLFSYGKPLSCSIILRTALWSHLLQLIVLGFMQFSSRSIHEQFHEGKWGLSSPPPLGCFNYCSLAFTQLLFPVKYYFKKLKHSTFCSMIENREIRND